MFLMIITNFWGYEVNADKIKYFKSDYIIII